MVRALLMTAALVLAAFPAAGGGIDMQEGQWEIRSSMLLEGKPVGMSTVTLRQCLTPGEPVPDPSNQYQECRVIETTRKGNTVAWTMECTTETGTIKNSGSITYEGDSFGGTATSDMTGMSGMAGRADAVTTIGMRGWRIGPCPEQ